MLSLAAGNGPTELRGAAVQVLAAMAHTPRSFGDSPAVAETLADWRDWLLDTLCQDGKETSGQAELKQDCIEALTGRDCYSPQWIIYDATRTLLARLVQGMGS